MGRCSGRGCKVVLLRWWLWRRFEWARWMRDPRFLSGLHPYPLMRTMVANNMGGCRSHPAIGRDMYRIWHRAKMSGA